MIGGSSKYYNTGTFSYVLHLYTLLRAQKYYFLLSDLLADSVFINSFLHVL